MHVAINVPFSFVTTLVLAGLCLPDADDSRRHACDGYYCCAVLPVRRLDAVAVPLAADLAAADLAVVAVAVGFVAAADLPVCAAVAFDLAGVAGSVWLVDSVVDPAAGFVAARLLARVLPRSALVCLFLCLRACGVCGLGCAPARLRYPRRVWARLAARVPAVVAVARIVRSARLALSVLPFAAAAAAVLPALPARYSGIRAGRCSRPAWSGAPSSSR